MKNAAVRERWAGWLGATAVLVSLLAGCAAPPKAAAPQQNLGVLQQQIDTQATRIAGLEAQSQSATLDAQAARIAVLETQVAQFPTPTIALPTETLMPAVTGLVMQGTTKGPADAKVTITEYVDYF
jgi:hypothetical protein